MGECILAYHSPHIRVMAHCIVSSLERLCSHLHETILRAVHLL